MIKRTPVLLGLVILFFSPFNDAIVLNELTVIKEEGRLNAEILVDDLSDINQEELSVRIASPALYRQLNLFYDTVLSSLEVEYRIVNQNEGVINLIVPYGTVSVFDLLVEIEWPQGRLVRRYAVRLADNLYASEERIVVSINPVEVLLEETDPRQAAINRINERMRDIEVDTVEGDNWRNVAEAIRQAYLRDEPINVEQVMLALRDRNSENFGGTRSSVLQVGASLRLPNYYEITLRDRRQAREIIAALFQSRAAEPLLTLSVTEPKTESGRQSLVQEELDKVQREEEDLKQQLALVDAQLEQVERLITLKEEEITVIQLAAAEQEDRQEILSEPSDTNSTQYLNNLETAIRDRVDTFFAEVRTQPLFWSAAVFAVILLSALYLFIIRLRRRSGRDRASLMRELRRSSMRDRQPHLFEQDAADDIDRSPSDSPLQKIVPKEEGSEKPEKKEVTEARKEGSLLQDNVRKANLDLARAYINMGESSRARSLLEEVIKMGSSEEQQQAKELLSQI